MQSTRVVLRDDPLAEALQRAANELKVSQTLILVVDASVTERGGDARRRGGPLEVPRLGVVIHSEHPSGFLDVLSHWFRPTERLFVHLVGTHDPLRFCTRDAEVLCAWMCTASTVSRVYLRGSRVFSQESLLHVNLNMQPDTVLQSVTYLDTHWCNTRPLVALGPGRLAVYSGGLGSDGRWRRVQVHTWAAHQEVALTGFDCGQRGSHGSVLCTDSESDPTALADTCLALEAPPVAK